MRRIALALSFCVLAGLGCKHVGGKSDVYQDPSNAELPAGIGGQPYPALGAPVTGTAVPEKLGAPVEKAK